jgi:hypothetical protein
VLPLVHAGLVDPERDPVGGQAQQPDVLGSEPAGLSRADHQHTRYLALRLQRYADHGLVAFRQQRLLAFRHAPREAVPVSQ